MNISLELQPCCGNRSGIGIYAYELSRRMVDHEGISFRGTLFNFLNRNHNRPSLEGISFPIDTCRAMPFGVYRRIWHWVPIAYNDLFPSADLSVFFNYIVPPRITGKVITTIHDMTYLRYPETMDRRNLLRIQRDIAYSIQRSDHIITVSQFSKQEIIHLLGVDESKISVVYNAPSLGEESLPFSQVQASYGIRQPYLLYVGTLEPRKNLICLLQAFHLLKKEFGAAHQLILAGGRGWNTQAIDAFLESSPFSQDIILTGYLSSAAKTTLYTHAAAFLFPSLYEGFGIPPLEAMEFGCPVICSNAASLPEVVGDAAHLVNPHDPLQLAEGIWKVLSDSSYAKQLSCSGKQRVQHFTWDRSARDFLKICRDQFG